MDYEGNEINVEDEIKTINSVSNPVEHLINGYRCV